MSQAADVITNFWTTQDKGDYTATVQLFAEDALFEDPVYGTFEGRDAIAGFMQKMNRVMAEQKTHFEVTHIAGDDAVAWAQWIAKTPNGDIHGCGLYKVANGKITYYKDYMDRAG